MSVDIEYAIKKDIRNNPVVREVDLEQKRELVRTLCLAAVVVAMLLFSAWQHYEIVDNGYRLSTAEDALAAEQATNRRLRVEVESWRTPAYIEEHAVADLHMTAPTADQTIVINRASSSVPGRAVVAQAR